VAEGLRLEDWIGEMVVAHILREPVADPDDAIVRITGFLRGVDPSGVIVHFDPQWVDEDLDRDFAHPEDPTPRYAFFPWRRVTLIERPEEPEE
jgi:hypothetical protein